MKSSKKTAPNPRRIHDLKCDEAANEAVQFELRNTDVKSCIKKCAVKHKKHLTKKGEAKRAKYRYLEDAYVVALNAHHRIDELQVYAKKKHVRFNKRTDLFGFVIKLTMPDTKTNRRLASEYAGALRYLYSVGTPGDHVAKELTRQGGISGCRKKLSELRRDLGKGRKPASKTSATKNWDKVKEGGPLAEFKFKSGKLKKGRYALLAGCNKNGALTVYKSISINEQDGAGFLRRIAK